MGGTPPQFDMIAVVSVVVTVIGVILSGYIGWRTVSEPRVAVEWRITHLSAPSSQLKLVANGHYLRDPWLARIEISQLGRRDLTAGHFAQPMFIDFGQAEALSDEATLLRGDTSIRYRTYSDGLRIEPGVLHKRSRLVFEVILDGRPEVSVRNPLQNAKFSAYAANAEPESKEVAPRWPIRVAALVLFCFAGWRYLQFAALVGPERTKELLDSPEAIALWLPVSMMAGLIALWFGWLLLTLIHYGVVAIWRFFTS